MNSTATGTAPTKEELRAALEAAGFDLSAHEVFEVASILKRAKGSPRIRAERSRTDALDDALAWIKSQEGLLLAKDDAVGGGIYLGSAPLTGLKGKARAKDSDAALVRVVLVDLDPVDASPEARQDAANLAQDVRAFLTTELGSQSPLIDSGRGWQIWLAHDPAAPTAETKDVRRRLLRALARRFDRDLAKVDPCTHNAARLVRLPGTVNLKTGERARLADSGDLFPSPPSLEDLDRLAAALGEPKAPTRKRPARKGSSRSRASAQTTNPRSAPCEAEVRAALAHVGADDRETWLHVGMALHHWGDPTARSLWDEWSGTSDKFDAAENEKTWRGFQTNGNGGSPRTLKSIFGFARDGGWPGWDRHREPPKSRRGGRRRGPNKPSAGRCERPFIVRSTETQELVNQAEQAVADAPRLGLFHRARTLVRVVGRAIESLPYDSLFELLTGAARWGDLNEKGEPSYTLPPKEVAKALYRRGCWPSLRELAAVNDAPSLRPDGSVVQQRGYDPASRILYRPDRDYPPVSDRPSEEDAKAALAKLHDVVCDFPWKEQSDQSAWVALVLTLVGRQAIDGPTPMMVIRAHERGTGKTLLADIASLIATGQEAPRMAQAGRGSSEEERKRLTALGFMGAPLALIDNVERPLGSDVLAAALTAKTYRDRLLGHSKIVDVPVPVLVATGNNVMVSGDLARRVVPIDLAAESEHPEERTGFRYAPLLGHVRTHRPALVVAALTILRWRFSANVPCVGLKPIGSYEAWSRVVREALVGLGEPDPAAGRVRVREEGDPQREADALALRVWHDLLGCEPVTARDLVRRARGMPDMADAMAGLNPRFRAEALDSNSLGYALRRLRGRPLDGLLLDRHGSHRGAVKWVVRPWRQPAEGNDG